MKTTLQFEDMELEVEYTHYDAERGERDQYGAPLEPDHDEYVEIESINDQDPDAFCKANNIAKEDIESDILSEHYDDLPF